MSAALHICVLCATHRGRRFLERLMNLLPDATYTVFSFREESWEPPYLEDLRRLATGRGARFFEARDVGQVDLATVWDAAPVDFLFAVSWRYLVPASVFSRSRRGAYVFHDSLLPAYRGFSPTVWAVANDETRTGVTLLTMADGVDAGQMVDQCAVPIGRDEFINSVMERVTDAYLELLEKNLPALLGNTARMQPQNDSLATYCCKRLPEDNRIDWHWPARRVFNLIRATAKPYPGAFCFLNEHRLRIWSATLIEPAKNYIGIVPGRVVERVPGKGALVLASDGPVFLGDVQLDDGNVVTADTVLKRISLKLT